MTRQRGVVLVVLIAVASSAVGQASRPSFESFARMFERTGPAGARTWSWPKAEAFRELFATYGPDARPHATFVAEALMKHAYGETKGMIRGVCSHTQEGFVFHVIGPYSGGSDIEQHMSDNPWSPDSEESLNAAQKAAGPVTVKERGWQNRTATLSSVQIDPVRGIPAELWADWVYTTTLLESDPDKPDDPTISPGQCSHDSGPIRQAIEHAALAAKDGRTGRFLRLRVRVLADAFERIAWSSSGDAAHGTPCDALKEAPIDLDRFFVGFVVAVDAPGKREVGINALRLARAIVESGRADAFIPVLRRLAQDPGSDEWNRFRATQVLVFTLGHVTPGEPLDQFTSMTKPFDEIAKGLRDLKLTALSRHWLGFE
jgi:hypothetical protein